MVVSVDSHLLIVRHPQTDANVDGRFVGRGDTPYTTLGELQRDLLATEIVGWAPDRIVSSPLRRTREVTELGVVDTAEEQPWGPAVMAFGTVEVTRQVVGFLRKRIVTGEVLGEEALDLPQRTLRTKATWWAVSPAALVEAQLTAADLPGALHAAEHAAIGLLPLFATCDRWDIGGVSTALHPDTERPTVFVYDGQAGGAGFAEQGFRRAPAWLRATRSAIADCGCADGCPSCVQSPKCGNGNDPLDKAGAARLLDVLLDGAPRG